MNHGLEITNDGTLIVTLPRSVRIRQVIVQEEQTFTGNLFIKDGSENSKEITDAIDEEIRNVPESEEGFYSMGSQMFIAGLTRAKEVVERIKKR